MPTPNDPVLSARASLASNTRNGAPEAVLDDCRRRLAAAKLERAIREAMDASPPLGALDRARLATLLAGGAR